MVTIIIRICKGKTHDTKLQQLKLINNVCRKERQGEGHIKKSVFPECVIPNWGGSCSQIFPNNIERVDERLLE